MVLVNQAFSLDHVLVEWISRACDFSLLSSKELDSGAVPATSPLLSATNVKKCSFAPCTLQRLESPRINPGREFQEYSELGCAAKALIES